MVRRARARSARLEEDTVNSRSLTPAFSSTLNAMLIGVIIIATMYFAREVLIPVALAGILSFMLAPLVRLLQKIKLPRLVAVLIVVGLAFTAIFALGRSGWAYGRSEFRARLWNRPLRSSRVQHWRRRKRNWLKLPVN